MMNEKSQSVWMEDGDRREDVSPWEENVSGRPDLNRPENNGNAMTEGEGAGRGSAQPVMGSAPGNADTHSAEKETSKDRNVQPGMGSAAGSRTAQQGTGSAAGSGTAQQGMEGRFVNGDVQKAVENNTWGAPAPGANRPAQGNPARMETEETKRMKDNFDFFGPAAFLYAVFYVFCMFRNGSGITFPFFVGAVQRCAKSFCICPDRSDRRLNIMGKCSNHRLVVVYGFPLADPCLCNFFSHPVKRPGKFSKIIRTMIFQRHTEITRGNLNCKIFHLIERP